MEQREVVSDIERQDRIVLDTGDYYVILGIVCDTGK